LTEAQAHLLLLSERSALAWVLREQRMAFSAQRATRARTLPIGHRLFLYTTRGCYHNPTRDRGRIIGVATVQSQVLELDTPVLFAGRTFTVGCRLDVSKLAWRGAGIELAPLVPNLATFENKRGWGAKMRQTLVPLADEDVPILDRLLIPLLVPRLRALDSYLDAVPSASVAHEVAK
jgi:hypothetical protein